MHKGIFRKMARILAWEVFYIAFVGILGGIAAGLLIDRLMFLIILKIVDYASGVSYRIELKVFSQTAAVFAGIFILVFLYDVVSIRRSSVDELLGSRRAGEKEPKARWLIVLVGLGCLGYGYYLANTVETIPTALIVLFFAVVLVMIGTYCLFLCGSVAILKFLRRRKSYYYRTNHFAAVSGLIYRMKQNAVGLANICILSTGVLLVVSTTVCLYAEMNDMARTCYPKELNLNMNRAGGQDVAQVEKTIQKTSEKLGIAVNDLLVYDHLDVSFLLKENELSADMGESGMISFDNVAAASFFRGRWKYVNG